MDPMFPRKPFKPRILSGKYSTKKDKTWGRVTVEEKKSSGLKRRIPSEMLTGKQKMATRTRFQWRYRNRSCFEQNWVKLDNGKEVPIAKQMVYITDSSEGEEASNISDKTNMFKSENRLTPASNLSDSHLNGENNSSDQNLLSNSGNKHEMKGNHGSTHRDEIEWDYSDINLTSQKVIEEIQSRNRAETSSYNQVLPNFEDFDQVDLETEVLVRHPKMGTRTLNKDKQIGMMKGGNQGGEKNKQRLKFITSFGFKPHPDFHISSDNIGDIGNSALKESNRSDSGIHDIFLSAREEKEGGSNIIDKITKPVYDELLQNLPSDKAIVSSNSQMSAMLQNSYVEYSNYYSKESGLDSGTQNSLETLNNAHICSHSLNDKDCIISTNGDHHTSFEDRYSLTAIDRNKPVALKRHQDIDKLILDGYEPCTNNIDSGKNSITNVSESGSSNVLTSELGYHEHFQNSESQHSLPENDLCCAELHSEPHNKHQTKIPRYVRQSRSEERHSPVLFERSESEATEESVLSGRETCRSKSLDTSGNSQDSARSRHNWSFEHMHEGYNIKCSLCKGRYERSKKYQHLKSTSSNLPDHHHHHPHDFGDNLQQIDAQNLHSKVITERTVPEPNEQQVKSSETYSFKEGETKGNVSNHNNTKDAHNNQHGSLIDITTNSLRKREKQWMKTEVNKSDTKPNAYAKSKFNDLLAKFEVASIVPQRSIITRSASYDGDLNKDVANTQRRKTEIIPQAYRKNVQLISKEFVKRTQSMSTSQPYINYREAQNTSSTSTNYSGTKYGSGSRSLRHRSSSFTSGITDDEKAKELEKIKRKYEQNSQSNVSTNIDDRHENNNYEVRRNQSRSISCDKQGMESASIQESNGDSVVHVSKYNGSDIFNQLTKDEKRQASRETELQGRENSKDNIDKGNLPNRNKDSSPNNSEVNASHTLDKDLKQVNNEIKSIVNEDRTLTWLKLADGKKKNLDHIFLTNGSSEHQRSDNKKYSEKSMLDKQTSTDCIENSRNTTTGGKNVAILDFSETEPTVIYNVQDGKSPKCGHIYHVFNSALNKEVDQEDKGDSGIIVNNKLTKDQSRLEPVPKRLRVQVDFLNDYSDQSFDSEDGSNCSILSITDTTLEENISNAVHTDESIIAAALPIHVYRSSYLIDSSHRDGIGSVMNNLSNMEFWYTQLLGVHRLILIARMCDHFGIRRWRCRRKRHVTVFYRDNFLVVCDRSDRTDHSREECSFDVSWSPEFMSTPRDQQSQETTGQTHVSVEPDSLEIDMDDIPTTESVKDALQRIMFGRMRVKLSTDEMKQGPTSSDSKYKENSYSGFERATNFGSQNSGKFDDVEFGSLTEESNVGDTSGYTSVWDSHIDSGYEFLRNRDNNVSQEELDTTGTLSNLSMLDTTLESNFEAKLGYEGIIADVIEKSLSPVCDDRKEPKKRKFATTMIIFTTDFSDSSASEFGSGDESSDQRSLHSVSSLRSNKTYHSSRTVTNRFMSAFSITNPNAKLIKSVRQRKMVLNRPKTDEVEIHKYVCLDMPVNVWPLADHMTHVGNTLPIKHIESDTSGKIDEPIDIDSQRKVLTSWAEKRELFVNSIMGNTSECASRKGIDYSDHSNDSIFSSDGTLTEIVTNSSNQKLAANTSNESAVGMSTNASSLVKISELQREPFIDHGNFNSDSSNCWDAYRQITANSSSSPLEKEITFPIEKCEEQEVDNWSSVIQEEVTRCTTQITGITLASCSLPIEEKTIENSNPDNVPNISEKPAKFHLELGCHTSNELEPTESGLKAKPPISPLGKNLRSPLEPRWMYNVTYNLNDDENEPGCQIGPDSQYPSSRAFSHQDWETEQWQTHFGNPSHSVKTSDDQWETHFGSCSNGPIINLPEEVTEAKDNGSLLNEATGHMSPQNKERSFNFISNKKDKSIDLATCSASEVVSRILGHDNIGFNDGPMKFTAYSNVSDHNNLFDTSINDTFSESIEEQPLKLNRTFSQLENSTRILRVMDFAAEGVDLMTLLNKTPRSQSCPNLTVIDPLQSVRDLDKIESSGITEHKTDDTEINNSYGISDGDIDLLNFLSVSDDKHNNPAREAMANDIENLVTEKKTVLLEKFTNQGKASNSNIAKSECKLDVGEDMQFSGRINRVMWEKPHHQENLYFQDVEGSIDLESTNTSDQELIYLRGDKLVNSTNQSNNRSENILSLADELQLAEDGISVKTLQDQAITNNYNSGLDSSIIDEEKSISVNISFEIEYSQRSKEPEKIQMLLKDCKFIRDDLLQDVAKITQEITKDLSENISDESLQLEWSSDKKDTSDDNPDELLFFTFSGNTSNTSAATTNNIDTSLKNITSKNKEIIGKNPRLCDVALQYLDISEKSGNTNKHNQNNVISDSEGPGDKVPHTVVDELIPVRIMLDGSEDETVKYMMEKEIVTQWENSIKTNKSINKLESPEQNIVPSGSTSTVNPQPYIRLRSDSYNSTVPTLRTLCYNVLYANRSSSEESFPLLTTSPNDADQDIYFLDNTESSREMGNLSLVSLSDLSGGVPSPHEHYYVTNSKGARLKVVKGYLSRSDDEHINFMSLRNRMQFSIEIGDEKHLNDLLMLHPWAWCADEHKYKRRYSAGDADMYKRVNTGSNNQEEIIAQNLNSNNSNSNTDDLGYTFDGDITTANVQSIKYSHFRKCMLKSEEGNLNVNNSNSSVQVKESVKYRSNQMKCNYCNCGHTDTNVHSYTRKLDESNSKLENQPEFINDVTSYTQIHECHSMDSTLSSSSRHEVDYGKFYNTSYLAKPSGVQLRGPSINPKGESKSPHFHRPDNFSYSQVRRDFIKPMRKGMMSALGETMATQKKTLTDFMDEPMKNKEVIQLAHYPDNIKHAEGEERVPPIEREDFPAPPATAAAYPELLYKYSNRRSRGQSSDIDSPDGAAMDVDNEEVTPDPRLQKDIDSLSKLEKESGAAKVILEDLKKKAKEPPPAIDPVSSSRTPSASKEPMYKTRYESHVFASPSRDLDYRARMYSFDDQMLGKKYRSALQSVGNFPVDRRTYELPKTRSNKFSVMKPGYTLRQPRTAHMPATYASARSNGYFSDIEQCVTRDSDFEDMDRRYEELERRSRQWNKSHELDRRSQELDRKVTENGGGRKSMEVDGLGGGRSSTEPERRSQKSQSLYTSQSSIEEYDPVTGLRKGKLRGSSVNSDFSKSKTTPFKKVLSGYHSDEPPQIYSYDELKITNLSLPPGVDSNWIEVHLSPDEFSSLFKMNREDFYRLAEWKRNDMKQRVLLF